MNTTMARHYGHDGGAALDGLALVLDRALTRALLGLQYTVAVLAAGALVATVVAGALEPAAFGLLAIAVVAAGAAITIAADAADLEAAPEAAPEPTPEPTPEAAPEPGGTWVPLANGTGALWVLALEAAPAPEQVLLSAVQDEVDGAMWATENPALGRPSLLDTHGSLAAAVAKITGAILATVLLGYLAPEALALATVVLPLSGSRKMVWGAAQQLEGCEWGYQRQRILSGLTPEEQAEALRLAQEIQSEKERVQEYRREQAGRAYQRALEAVGLITLLADGISTRARELVDRFNTLSQIRAHGTAVGPEEWAVLAATTESWLASPSGLSAARMLYSRQARDFQEAQDLLELVTGLQDDGPEAPAPAPDMNPTGAGLATVQAYPADPADPGPDNSPDNREFSDTTGMSFGDISRMLLAGRVLSPSASTEYKQWYLTLPPRLRGDYAMPKADHRN